ALQMPADKRIAQQFFLEDDTELKWQIDVEHWNIKRRAVIHRVDVGLAGIDLLQAGNRDRRQDRLHDQLRPQPGQAMLRAAIAVEQRYGQRNNAQNDGVQPDQRVEEEVGTQPAPPSIAPLWEYAIGCQLQHGLVGSSHSFFSRV